jgi:hypothetical protein
MTKKNVWVSICGSTTLTTKIKTETETTTVAYYFYRRAYWFCWLYNFYCFYNLPTANRLADWMADLLEYQ